MLSVLCTVLYSHVCFILLKATEVDVQLLKHMKDTMAAVAPQFAGHAQQDAQGN